MTAPVEITQADREAAAANIKRRLVWQHGGEQPWMDASTTSMRLGEQDDHDEVQAFARHRQSPLPKAGEAGRVEAVAAAIFEADPDVGCTWTEWVAYAEAHPDHQQDVEAYRRQARAVVALPSTTTHQAGEGVAAAPVSASPMPGSGKVHHIKCWPDVFEEMRVGRKTAEFRYNDRDYQAGDTLLIREWDTATGAYTHREITRLITHVLSHDFGVPAGYAMLSLAHPPSADQVGEGVAIGAGQVPLTYPCERDRYGGAAPTPIADTAGVLPRPFSEWHEDYGDVLWWRMPIMESPYVGSPLDLGRSMKVVVQVGFEEHDLPITMTGGWPFSEEDEARLFWTPLPDAAVVSRAALSDTGAAVEEGR